jgi:hypothetical protein
MAAIHQAFYESLKREELTKGKSVKNLRKKPQAGRKPSSQSALAWA